MLRHAMHIGYDVVYKTPGEVEELFCAVCGETMNVSRNLPGQRGRAAAMFGNSFNHDEFVCQNAGTEWHNQAIQLLEFIENTPSYELERIVREELRQIIYTKKATK